RLSEHVERVGRQAQEGWTRLARRHGFEIAVRGFPALTSFALDTPENPQTLVTLLTQLMLERGYLATMTFYPTYAQTESVVSDYLAALDEVLGLLRQAIDRGDVKERLRGPAALTGFARLT